MTKCGCCHKVKKLIIKSQLGGHCNYCYHNCESITGVPYCHFERKKIGGYWERKNSNKFRKLDGAYIKVKQELYFTMGKFEKVV